MTFAVLTTRYTANSQVRGFHLCASEDLETRIIKVASHDLGLKLHNSNGNLMLNKGMIPLHKLLSWIKSSGYELNSTMTFDCGGAFGNSYYEKYVFEERGK